MRKKKPEIFLTGLLLKTKLSSLAGLPHQRDYDMRVVVTGLTKSEAMVAEQVLISAYTLKYLDRKLQVQGGHLLEKEYAKVPVCCPFVPDLHISVMADEPAGLG